MPLGSHPTAAQLGEQPCRRVRRRPLIFTFYCANTSRVAETFGWQLGASLVLVAHACAIPVTLKVLHPPPNSGERAPYMCLLYPLNTSHNAQPVGCQPWAACVLKAYVVHKGTTCLHISSTTFIRLPGKLLSTYFQLSEDVIFKQVQTIQGLIWLGINVYMVAHATTCDGGLTAVAGFPTVTHKFVDR